MSSDIIAQGPVECRVSRPPVADKYVVAVKLPDGSVENFTLKVGGKSFRCQCGGNVFHKPDRKHLELYECNACEVRYEGG